LRISSAALLVKVTARILRPGVAVADEMGDPARDDAGLARSRAGEDQQRSIDVENGLSLFRIEGVEQVHSDWALPQSLILP
jgi:hypothetical protein